MTKKIKIELYSLETYNFTFSNKLYKLTNNQSISQKSVKEAKRRRTYKKVIRLIINYIKVQIQFSKTVTWQWIELQF
jgi:hypothetical protein